MIQHEKSGSRKHRCRVAYGRAHLGETLAKAHARLPDEVESAFFHHYHTGTESVTLSDRRAYDVEVMEICSRVCAGSATLRN